MASIEWTDPWACGACTYHHVEPTEARLASCSICGARRPGSAVPYGSTNFHSSAPEVEVPPAEGQLQPQTQRVLVSAAAATLRQLVARPGDLRAVQALARGTYAVTIPAGTIKIARESF